MSFKKRDYSPAELKKMFEMAELLTKDVRLEVEKLKIQDWRLTEKIRDEKFLHSLN